MKLRKPCEEHNMYCPHPTFDGKAISLISAQEIANSNQNHRLGDCPGGVFLPDDALVIENVDIDRESLAAAVKSEQRAMSFVAMVPASTTEETLHRLTVLSVAREYLDALSVREAE